MYTTRNLNHMGKDDMTACLIRNALWKVADPSSGLTKKQREAASIIAQAILDVQQNQDDGKYNDDFGSQMDMEAIIVREMKK